MDLYNIETNEPSRKHASTNKKRFKNDRNERSDERVTNRLSGPTRTREGSLQHARDRRQKTCDSKNSCAVALIVPAVPVPTSRWLVKVGSIRNRKQAAANGADLGRLLVSTLREHDNVLHLLIHPLIVTFVCGDIVVRLYVWSQTSKPSPTCQSFRPCRSCVLCC